MVLLLCVVGLVLLMQEVECFFYHWVIRVEDGVEGFVVSYVSGYVGASFKVYYFLFGYA